VEGSVRIAIASDHAGFEQKQQLVDWLVEQEWDVLDLCPDGDARVDYPDYAAKVAEMVAEEEGAFGVLVCGTGIGMAITANKFPGVRAANVTAPEFAALAREHNDANVVALSGRFVTPEVNRLIVDTFLSTAFGGGRHGERVEKIAQIEDEIQAANMMFAL
jgi:ribose 5-phosphate isomerase B